jgi:hypothetical protein
MPGGLIEPNVDEARPGDRSGHHAAQFFQLGRQQPGKRARIGTRPLGEHHRRVDRQIAMRRIARRLHRHRAALQASGQDALGFELIEHGIELRGETGVESHGGSCPESGRLSAGSAEPSSELAMLMIQCILNE